MTLVRYRIEVTGIVQGVGFRPFVYKLATALQLSGHVYNHAAGVTVEIEGTPLPCQSFLRRLQAEAPALAVIQSVSVRDLAPLGTVGFAIKESVAGRQNTLVSADMCVCVDCLADLFDPQNRRYLYAFTNCTNCGPRFTIMQDLPYDRKHTTMQGFALCPDCAAEYNDPLDRRFHAQPNACPVCGPQLSYLDADGHPLSGDPLELAGEALADGKIIAIKGLGGFHLACSAQSEHAVHKLRQRKYRWQKPFAVMVGSIAIARQFCELASAEADMLGSPQRPIVLAKKRPAPDMHLAAGIAPENDRIGIMLPYTPLHYLLMEQHSVLVMTSANVSDEPIAYEDADALLRLWEIAEGFLTHNREIFRRCDDSVMVYAADAPRILRRARGFAPQPLPIWDAGKSILATGGEQKNTFCLTRGGQAFLSQHIGDLDNLPTKRSYEREISYFSKMFAATPTVIAYDMHPNYLSTRYALEQPEQLTKLAVQHHHAHLASVLAEHGKEAEPAIGFIYDGTGYGEDGTLWGGEVLVGDCAAFSRRAALLPFALPGAAQAIHEPWRVALSLLWQAFGSQAVEHHAPAGLLQPNWRILLQAMEQGLMSPRSSGMGRLFDAVAALLGIGREVHYEGQAAVELEQVVVPHTVGSYPYRLVTENDFTWVDWMPLLQAILAEQEAAVPIGEIATRFHHTVVDFSLALAQQIRTDTGLSTAAFSGGCWQNSYLLERAYAQFTAAGFTVLLNEQVPTNDGGLAYGQAAVAAAKIRKGQ